MSLDFYWSFFQSRVLSIYLGGSWGAVLFSFGSALFLASLFVGRSFADNGGKMLTGSPNFRLLWNKFCDSLTLNCTQMKFLNGMYLANYKQKTSSIDKYAWMFNHIRKTQLYVAIFEIYLGLDGYCDRRYLSSKYLNCTGWSGVCLLYKMVW